MFSPPRLFALLGIVAVSGCAGSTVSSPPMPSPPQSLRQSAPASKPVVFISVASMNAIESFPAGVASPQPHVAIRDGINRPTAIAVGGSGTLFVTNTGNGTITEYPPGATKPNFTLTFPTDSYTSIAAGADDTLYVT